MINMDHATSNPKKHINFRKFVRKESAAGLALIAVSLLAIVLANTPFSHYYKLLINTPFTVALGDLTLSKPVLLWVNDGLMAVFFFLIGLELKRELVEGQLSSKANIILPGVAAIGGMLIPASIYLLFNYGNPNSVNGWAIPVATDIAFALGILSLFGTRVPIALKIFLTSLAIFDDIGAIIIIAIFYTKDISVLVLLIASLCIVILFLLNKKGIYYKSLYLFIGAIMWLSFLKSGVHATLAGIVMAMFIPLQLPKSTDISPLKTLEHDLHAAVAFLIIPVFAFCNAGISISKIGVNELLDPVPLGIILGLFIGKPLGIFSLCWITIKLGFAKLPDKSNYLQLFGISVLCGVGFTMSLFISSLAFQETGVNLIFDNKLGIIIGSLLSGIVGFVILNKSLAIDKESKKINMDYWRLG